MVKSRKLHKIDWIVHFILLHSIQSMMYYSRKSLEYFKGIHTYQTTVIQYYPNIYIVLSHLNVNLVCLTPTINPINESWSEFQIQPDELQHFRNDNCSREEWILVLQQRLVEHNISRFSQLDIWTYRRTQLGPLPEQQHFRTETCYCDSTTSDRAFFVGEKGKRKNSCMYEALISYIFD